MGASPGAEADGNWLVGSAELTKREVRVGEGILINWSAENRGFGTAELNKDLRINGEIVTTLNTTALAGETVRFSYLFNSTTTGTYLITLDGSSPISIVVREPASLKLVRLEGSPQKLHLGDTMTISYEIANVGGAPGGAGFDIRLNGRVVRAETVNVEPGKSVQRTVQLTIEQRGVNVIEMGDLETLVVALLPATFEYSNFTVPSLPVPTGSPVSFVVDMSNVGDEVGSSTIDLKVDNVVKVSKVQSLSPGQTIRLEMSWTPEQSGTYSVAIADLPWQTLVAKRPAAFSFSQFAVSPLAIEVDQNLTARVVVSNIGEMNGTHLLRFLVDGAIDQEQSITLQGGQDQVVDFQWSSPTPSLYTVGFEGVGAKQVTVLRPAKALFDPFKIKTESLHLGDTLRVTGTLKNTGEVVGLFTVPLYVDGVEVATTIVHALPGATVNIPELTYQLLRGGTHTIRLGDTAPQSVMVGTPKLLVTARDQGGTTSSSVAFYFTVKNNGTGIARGVILSTWKGSNHLQPKNITIGDIAPGESITKTVYYNLSGGWGCQWHDIYYMATPAFGPATTPIYHRYCQ